MQLPKSHTVLKSTIIVGIATMFAKTIGFAREMVLAAFYGTGTTSDAFILAYTIPDTLLYFISVSIASSYISLYPRMKEKLRFTRNVMTALLLAGLLFSVIFSAFPSVLVKLFAAGAEPETFHLTTYFVRYMVWSAVFILLAEVYNAHLELHGDFFSAGIRSIWRNLMVILGIILGALSGNNLIIALAPLAGNALCVCSLAAACRKHGYTYRPYLDIHSHEFRQLLLLIVPMFLSTAAIEINSIINRNFAALLPAGAISSLNYGNKIQVLFVALIGQSLFTVLFPHMSQLAADGKIAKLKNTLTRGILYMFAIVLPICIGIIILAQPCVRILFQRGSFTGADTVRTASCLRMYAVLIISGSINPLIMRAFYAIQNTKAPANASIVTVLLNILFSLCLIKPLGVKGLALANSFSGILTTLLLLILLRRKLGHLGLKQNFPELIKMLSAAGIMGFGVWLMARWLPLMSLPALQSALLCAFAAAVAALIYLVLLLLLRSKIAFEFVNTMRKYFVRHKKRGS